MCQVSLSFTISWNLLSLISIESVMPCNHLISFAPFSSCPVNLSLDHFDPCCSLPPIHKPIANNETRVHYCYRHSVTKSRPTLLTPWIAGHWASVSFAISQSLLKLMPIESVMMSNHLILCHPLLFLPFIFSSIRVFSSESALHFKWSKYWNFSFSISPSNE